jgi:hypothetical protein
MVDGRWSMVDGRWTGGKSSLCEDAYCFVP